MTRRDVLASLMMKAQRGTEAARPQAVCVLTVCKDLHHGVRLLADQISFPTLSRFLASDAMRSTPQHDLLPRSDIVG